MRINPVAIFLLLVLLLACSIEDRVWENPYDPHSDRSLWTPVNFKAAQLDTNRIQLTWERKGLDFDGFKIDKRVGDKDWQDSIVTLGDSTLSWIDTALDLKVIVQDPSPITYRLTAYAGDYYSNSVQTKINPLIPAIPAAVNVDSVYYFIGAQGDTMAVKWTPTTEVDFKQYNLYQQIGNGDTLQIDSFNDIKADRYFLTKFDPTVKNTFLIGVVDTTDRETRGKGKSSLIDPPPQAVTLDSITYQQGLFSLRWSQSTESDFKHYVIQEVDSTGSVIDEKSTITVPTNTTAAISTAEDKIHYYRIVVQDHWDQSAASQFQWGSSFQSIVVQTVLDTVNGSDIRIINHDKTIATIIGVQAIKPVWIQGGKKIFAFVAGAAGLIANADGSNLNIISGIPGTGQPQFVNFSTDGKKAILSTDEGVLCTLEEIDSTHFLYNQLTIVENNQFYGEAGILPDGRYICWKDSNQANNNRGVRNIYILGLNGTIETTIKRATDFQKYINPRLSPDGKELVYVLTGSGLYLSDKNGDNETLVSSSKFPESSYYFKNLRWSPNSDQVLFWSDDSTIYTFDVPFGGQVNSIHAGSKASWSDNGQKIMFYNSGQWVEMDVITKEITNFSDEDWAQLQPRQ